MNKINIQFNYGSCAEAQEITIQRNVLAWQEARREQRRHARAAREARQFRANFGRVNIALPKGFVLAAA